MSRVPGLDGLRAISIILVLCGHVAGSGFIIFVTLAQYCGLLSLHSGDLAHAYTCTMNHFPDGVRSWWVGHPWSLSVEEQFYLLWPATLLLLGVRRGLRAAAAVVVLVPFIRVASSYMWGAQRSLIGNTFQTVADVIATGCLLAGYKNQLMHRA